MDISRCTQVEKLLLSRHFYHAGFVFLPVIWLLNLAWFFYDAFPVNKPTEYIAQEDSVVKPEGENKKDDKGTVNNYQFEIKKYVIGSSIGFVTYMFILASWIYYYQTNRVSWGYYGELITRVIPKGRP